MVVRVLRLLCFFAAVWLVSRQSNRIKANQTKSNLLAGLEMWLALRTEQHRRGPLTRATLPSPPGEGVCWGRAWCAGRVGWNGQPGSVRPSQSQSNQLDLGLKGNATILRDLLMLPGCDFGGDELLYRQVARAH